MIERIIAGGIALDVEWDPIFQQLIPEIEGAYEFDSIPWEPGDIVLDIGAHQGVVSMYLAKRYGCVVHSYEPVAENFARLKRNLRRNKVTTVHPHKLAVTCDGRYLTMVPGSHSAEGSAWWTSSYPPQAEFRVRSTTLQRILYDNGIGQVKLLKLDCEGAEHEILRAAVDDDILDRFDYVRGEIHMLPPLAAEGWTVAETMATVPEHKVAWQVVEL